MFIDMYVYNIIDMFGTDGNKLQCKLTMRKIP